MTGTDESLPPLIERARAVWQPVFDGTAKEPDYAGEARRRIDILLAAQDPKVQAALKVFYATRPAEFINDFCITYDPRKSENKTMPFMLFPRQVEFVEFLHSCVQDRQPGLVEKTRDAGISYLCCAYGLWQWLFVPGAAVGFGSWKSEYVDERGNPKSTFEKIRQMIEALPAWLLPVGYAAKNHSFHMRILNPETGASIVGECGDNIGRGGRTTLYVKDESAHYEHPESIEAALGNNTEVQIDVSSVNGTGNVFYNKRMAGVEWSPGAQIESGYTRVFIFDWTEDPRKSPAWYNENRARYEREGLLHVFRQEVERDYAGAIENVVIPSEWVEAAIDAHTALELPEAGAWSAAQDVADGGGDKNALAVSHGVVLRHLSAWSGEAGEAPAIAIPICRQFGVQSLNYDCIGVGAGFKAGTDKLRALGQVTDSFKLVPWDAGSEVRNPESRLVPSDSESPRNGDFFKNFKAQSWWSLRTRFYKTYRWIKFGEPCPADEIISLPSALPEIRNLVRELSQPTYVYTPDGRVLIDKRPEGMRSPNLADAVMMCYNPIRPRGGFFF